MKDFGPSWRNGVAFNSVIYAIRPDLVDMELVRRRSNRENLEDAFTLAEHELGIPRLLDPEGAASFPVPVLLHIYNTLTYIYIHCAGIIFSNYMQASLIIKQRSCTHA